jgi:hypothetical protein
MIHKVGGAGLILRAPPLAKQQFVEIRSNDHEATTVLAV